MKYSISVSQIKTYLKSPAEWAGQKILWLSWFEWNESTISGNMLHTYMECKVKNSSIIAKALNDYWISDTSNYILKKLRTDLDIKVMENFIELVSNFTDDTIKVLKAKNISQLNLKKIKFRKIDIQEIFDKYNRAIESQQQYTPEPYNNPITETRIDFQFEWIDMIAIIDVLTDDFGIDYKTFATKVEEWKTWWNMFSALSTREEYELQAWIYFYALHSIWKDVQKFKFALFCNKEYKTYKQEDYHKIIEFNYSDERNQKMMNRYLPTIKAIVELYDKFDSVREWLNKKDDEILEYGLDF